MRVPGNERAFTVSPAGGIPFPQLVCIGAAGGQSQAFPVSAWARPAAALLELARAPPRATVQQPWPGRGGSPCRPLPRHPRRPTHAHAHAATLVRNPAATRGVTRLLHSLWVGFAGRSGVTGSRGPPETLKQESKGRSDLGTASCARSSPRPAGGRRPASPGLITAIARLQGPGLASRNGPRQALHCVQSVGQASASREDRVAEALSARPGLAGS